MIGNVQLGMPRRVQADGWTVGHEMLIADSAMTLHQAILKIWKLYSHVNVSLQNISRSLWKIDFKHWYQYESQRGYSGRPWLPYVLIATFKPRFSALQSQEGSSSSWCHRRRKIAAWR